MTRIALLAATLLAAGCATDSSRPNAATDAAVLASTPAPSSVPSSASNAAAPVVAATVEAPHQPLPPYYSLQLAAAPGRTMALETLKGLADAPYARAEKRKSGYMVRVGAWATREEAQAAAADYSRFGKGVSALQLENPVDWLLPDGSVLPASTAAAAAAPALPAVGKQAADNVMRDAASKLDASMRAALKGGLTRKDGYIYVADVAPLLAYAAQRKDLALYEQAAPYAAKLVFDVPEDPYARGFVAARAKEGAKPERSDAGAMLALARALWAGADAFNRDGDRDLAKVILAGYARHAYEMQGTWLVRHSFDYGPRSFTSYSLISDYDAAFLAQADGGEWKGFGARAAQLVGSATGRAGLLRPLVMPEIGATYGSAGIGATIAPNNHSPVEASCLAASGDANAARALLGFVAREGKKGALQAFYNVDTGAAGPNAPLAVTGLACLESLAGSLDDGNATAVLDARFTSALKTTKGSDLANALPLLAAAQARGAF